jgi:hypothetical protein
VSRTSVSEIDDTLQEQLARWPGFRFVPAEGCFVNNCMRCGAVQDDMELHSEPDHPFFNIPDVPPTAVQLIPISGTVQLNGCESFAI